MRKQRTGESWALKVTWKLTPLHFVRVFPLFHFFFSSIFILFFTMGFPVSADRNDILHALSTSRWYCAWNIDRSVFSSRIQCENALGDWIEKKTARELLDRSTCVGTACCFVFLCFVFYFYFNRITWKKRFLGSISITVYAFNINILYVFVLI